MGSALLLLGSGLTAAQINLDGSAATNNAPVPVRIAVETIPAAAAVGQVMAHAVNVGDTDIQVTGKTAVPGTYFVRVAFSGAVFAGASTDPSGFTKVAGGVAGSDHVVYGVPAAGITLGTAFTMEIDDDLAVTSDDMGTVRATITAHDGQFKAIDGEGALEYRHFGGSAVIIQKVSGIAASVMPGTTATADVAVGFRWFVNPDAPPANTASAHLGTASVRERLTGDDSALNAGTGAALVAGALIADARGVRITVEGDLSIGAFNLTRDNPATPADPANDPPMVEVTCPDPETGSAEVPLTGNVMGTEEMPNSATVSTVTPAGDTGPLSGGVTGLYTLCVTVDTMGAMSNETALPVTEYMGTITLPQAVVGGVTSPMRELASGVIGKIARNGASVRIPYLTTSEKHNQRLIIVNQGARPISITDIAFQTEPGTEADLSDAAKAAAANPELGMIMPGESAVHSVKTMLSITGNSRRTGAMLSFNGLASQISVATTQVNLSDSSTDTVVYSVE